MDILTKEFIREKFQATRPDYPDEFFYLWHMVRSVQKYLQKILKNDNFTLKVRHYDGDDRDLRIPVKKKDGFVSTIGYHGEPFLQRLMIAQALAGLVLRTPNSKFSPKTMPINNYDLYYFAEEILILNAKLPNGAVLRKPPVPPEDIPQKVAEYTEKEYSEQKLTPEQKERVQDALKHLIKGYPEVKEGFGVLSCEIDIIEEYLKKTVIDQNYKIQSKSVTGIFNIKTVSSCIPQEYVFTIRSIDHDELKEILSHNPAHKKIEPLRLIRLGIAHELGHAVLHSKIGIRKHDPNQEREAAYFALLMLEHREYLYNNRIKNENYKEACKEWHKLFRFLHSSEENKDFVESVLADNEW